MSWRQKVKKLVEENDFLREQVTELRDQVYCLQKHIKVLEGVINKYNNENTPSSKKPEWDKKKSPDRIGKEKNPIGKPKGGNGGTRPIPEIKNEKVIRLSIEGEAYFGQPIDYIERVVCDVPEIQPVEWTRYFLAQYIDPITHDTITAPDPGCPLEGMFGPNIQTMITILREKVNASEKQTIELLGALYTLDGVAPATIEAELRRTASVLKPGYDAIGKTIDEAEAKHSDETGQSVDGNNWCMYCFSTKEHTYYFCNEKKRADHIRDKLHDDWNKILTCDGHSIYDWWHSKQRCWSHATRKDAWLIDQEETEERILLHEGVSGTFKICKELLKKEPPGVNHIWDVVNLRNRLNQLVNYKWKEEKCRKVANYMQNGLDAWFTFMLVPGVEPTNNLNERDIRKHVMKRRNSGTFRSEQGLRNHCIILSLLETWNKNGKNIYTTLRETLKNHNSKLRIAS